MLMSEFHSLLVRLSRDDVDSVRLLVVQSCVQISKVYAKDTNTRADNVRPRHCEAHQATALREA